MALVVKNTACQSGRHNRHGFGPWVGMITWRNTWQPTPVFLPGESHGQRSLVGYGPYGHKESDMTEANLCIFLMEMFALSYVNVLYIYPRLCLQVVPPNDSEPTWQTSMLYSDIVPLTYVNETICMVICPSTDSSQSFYGPGWIIWYQDYPKSILWMRGLVPFCFKTFLPFINRLLVTI